MLTLLRTVLLSVLQTCPSLPVIEARFYELGPTPYLCFENEIFLIEYRESRNVALRGLSLAYFESLTSCNRLGLDGVSRKIFMLRHSSIDIDLLSVSVYIQPISPFIASEFAHRMQALKRYELVDLFNHYNLIPYTRKMSCNVFEAYCHIIFSTRIKFDYVPMVRIGGQPIVREKRVPQRLLSHTELSRSPEVLRVASLDMPVNPYRAVDYDSNEIAKGLNIKADVYYIPIKTIHAGIDSFILHDKILYLFQMTVSDTDISDELWPFLASLKGLPHEHNWRFIFIKSPGKILACPILPHSAELWDLELYSAEIKVIM